MLIERNDYLLFIELIIFFQVLLNLTWLANVAAKNAAAKYELR